MLHFLPIISYKLSVLLALQFEARFIGMTIKILHGSLALWLAQAIVVRRAKDYLLNL